MGEKEFASKDVCDERHKNIEGLLTKIDGNITTLYNRLNGFYVVAISALVAAVTSLIQGCH